MSGVNVQPPPLNTRVVDPRGMPTQALRDFLYRLWQRTGGNEDEVDYALRFVGGSAITQVLRPGANDEAFTAQIANLNATLQDQQTQINTLVASLDAQQMQIDDLNTQITGLQVQIDTLTALVLTIRNPAGDLLDLAGRIQSVGTFSVYS